MDWIKKKWQSFTEWQHEPVTYKAKSAATVKCLNCGDTFTGNYCPTCGQSAAVGPITPHKVMRGAMDVWGLGGILLLRNLGHLMLRPGYLIADYLHGRRQMYFPPFKTLFLVAALNLVLERIAGAQPELFTAEDGSQEAADVLNAMVQTADDYQAFLGVIMAVFMAIIARMVFSYSPRLGRVNMGECVFVQVWMVNQLLIVDIIDSIMDLVLGGSFDDILLPVPFIYIAYKQLFGYGWWGTLWRTAVVQLLLFVIFFIILATILSVY